MSTPIPLDLADLRSTADRLDTEEQHRAAARLRVAADELEQLRAARREEHHYCNVLLDAITKSTQRCGLCRRDVELLDGPTALMMLDDMAAEIERLHALAAASAEKGED